MRTSLNLVWLTFLEVLSASSFGYQPLPVPEINERTLSKHGPRVFGGAAAADGEFPYMILIKMRVRRGWGMCSGSLVSAEWVMTAAHCFQMRTTDGRIVQAKNIWMIAGKANLADYITKEPKEFDTIENKAEVRQAKKVVLHPHYVSAAGYVFNDIALVSLDTPFSDSVKILTIATEKSADTVKNCTLLGWGKSGAEAADGKLKFAVGVDVHPASAGCKLQKYFEPVICYTSNQADTCEGDSGSPLVCNGVAVGVCSYGLPKANHRDECWPNEESYSTEVFYYQKWLSNVVTTGGSSDQVPPTANGSPLLVIILVLLTLLT